MNIKGASRAGGRELADHLGNAQKNEKVTIVRVDGTVAQDLHGAFAEMEAVASGTRAKKPLYHAKISPDPKEPRLTPQQWDRAVDALGKELGLDGHAYAFVLHQKYGKFTPDVLREHGHVVWFRVNPDTMLTTHDGHNYRKHEVVARQLEREFGHARIQGAHAERNGQPRPERTPPQWAMLRAATSGIHPRSVAETVTQLWGSTDNPGSFAAGLKGKGLILAVGKRDLVVVDGAGDVHTLARSLGLKAAEIRQRLAGIDRDKLPTVDQAREAIRSRKPEREAPAPVWDRNADNAAWMDAVIDAAIDKEKAAPRFLDPKPEGGTLPPPPQAQEDRKEVYYRDLAQKIQEQKPREKQPEIPAHEIEAIQEKLAVYGFDATKPESVTKWQELERKVDAGHITEKDRLREMALYLWQQEDREHRTGHSHQPEPQRERHREEREPDRDR